MSGPWEKYQGEQPPESGPWDKYRESPERGGSLGDDLAYSIGGGFNRGLAKAVGAPVDMMTAGLNLIPGVDIEDPVGGSAQLERGMSRLGLSPGPGEEVPHPFIGRVSEEVGAATVPFGAVGGIARTGATGGRFGGPILRAFRESPKLNVAGELSSAVGAGTGAAVAREVAPDSPTTELIAQLAGGFAHPVAVGADSTRAGAGTVKRVFGPYMPGGARRTAADQMGRVVEDPQAAARTLSQPQDAVPGAQLTPAQETGDRGLLALERALGRARPDIEQHLGDAARATQRAVRDEAQDLGGAMHAEPRAHLSERVQGLSDQMDARINQAVTRAREQIESVDPATPREQLSRVARENLEEALSAERAREAAVWSRVPEDVPASTVGMKETYQGIRGRLRKAEEEDMPEFIGEYLGQRGRLADSESLGELQAFRSKLLREIRRERAQDVPSRRRIAILEEMQDATLDAMQATQAGPALDDALAFTRQLNERFTQGPVGRILGHERRGGLAVAPEQTLDRLLARDSVEGLVNHEALMRAADTPEMRNTAADYIRHRFIMQATKADGAVQPGAARRFMRNNSALLERMPEVRKQLEGATSAQEVAERTQSTMLARQRSLVDKRKSRAALYLDAPIGREIRTVLNSKNPEMSMRQLVAQTRRDSTGSAKKGLQSQFIDEMMTQAERSGGLSGAELGKFLEKNRAMMLRSGLFNYAEIRRLERMRDTLTRVENQIGRGRRVDEILDETPDAITDLAARIVGANIGAQGAGSSTGAPLVAAHAGSKFVRRLTNMVPFERTRDVLTEAILDRNVMRDLLERTPTARKADAISRRMNAWLVNLVTEDDNGDGPLQIEINRDAESFPDSMILKKDGSPFQTRTSAELAARGRPDLKGRGYVPVETGGGWGLAPSDEQEP